MKQWNGSSGGDLVQDEAHKLVPALALAELVMVVGCGVGKAKKLAALSLKDVVHFRHAIREAITVALRVPAAEAGHLL